MSIMDILNIGGGRLLLLFAVAKNEQEELAPVVLDRGIVDAQREIARLEESPVPDFACVAKICVCTLSALSS